MLYFPFTKAKNWNVAEAISVYDKNYTDVSFVNILTLIDNDLVAFSLVQTSSKKYIDPIQQDIKKLRKLNCLQGTTVAGEGQASPPIQDTSKPTVDTSGPDSESDERLPSAINPVKISKLINNSVVNIATHHQIHRKRSIDSSNSRAPNDGPSCMVLTEGTKQFKISTPDHRHDEIHRPKLRKAHLDALETVVHFGTSFASDNPITKNTYKTYQLHQQENKSLRDHRLLEHIRGILEMEDIDDDFIQQLWTRTPKDPLSEKGSALLKIMRHTLTSFHLALSNTSLFTQNHERTSFIENIIPSLLSLSKVTGFVEFKWCETEVTSSKSLALRESDYHHQGSRKYADALGVFQNANKMEVIVVEASSGILKERTAHTIEDCLKLLECSVKSLQKEAMLNKDASMKTFGKLKVFAIQVIKNQVTLSEVHMNDQKSWCFVEKRTATLPSTWDDRILLVRYLELIATLFDDLCRNQYVVRQLLTEKMGFDLDQGPLVGAMFD
ncbi:hypothetical protein BC941DRAFT_473351 [Chlamydoabsidia padenii]|nr:hypothetical protein BC941DRAFT_473351 [Chlamydoabsidia padenii]